MSKVSTIVFVAMVLPSRWITIRRASVTPLIFSFISSSVACLSSKLFMTPLEEFKLLCGGTVTGMVPNCLQFKSCIDSALFLVSIISSPDRVLVTPFGLVIPIVDKALLMAKILRVVRSFSLFLGETTRYGDHPSDVSL